jgi:hypothetical protein
MDKSYAETVRLLLNAAPGVFNNAIFIMKGGTAVNLFASLRISRARQLRQDM